MGRASWLPEVLRGAGLQVHEVPGWDDRGGGIQFDPRAIVCHATAGSRSASDQDEVNVLLKGSSTAPPPIAQLYLSRTGTWHVVASGRCNHIGDAPLPGTGKRGNRYALGVEAANDNRDEPWPAVQYLSYVRGVAAICRHLGWSDARVFAHKEISSSGKTDPTFSMPTFRANVAAVLRGDSIPGDNPMSHAEATELRYGTPEGVHPSLWETEGQAPSLQHMWSADRGEHEALSARLDGLEALVKAIAEKVGATGEAAS